MDLEPQRRNKINPNKNLKIAKDEEEEVTEGMTERERKTDDLKDSPLKLFMSSAVFLLVAGLVMGAIYYFFFRGST